MALGKMFEKTIKLVGTVSKVGVQLGADIVGTVAEKIDDDPEIKRRISEYGSKKGQYIKAMTSEVASKSSDIVDRAVETSMNVLKDGSVRIKDSVSQVVEGVDSSIKGMRNYNSQTMQNHSNKSHYDSVEKQSDKIQSDFITYKKNYNQKQSTHSNISNTLPIETYSISEIKEFSNYDFLIISKFISVSNKVIFDIIVKGNGINIGNYILINNTSGTFATRIISIDSAVNEYDILKDGTINIIKKGVPRCIELYKTGTRNEILSIVVQGTPANYRFIGRNELAKGTISTEEKYSDVKTSEKTTYKNNNNEQRTTSTKCDSATPIGDKGIIKSGMLISLKTLSGLSLGHDAMEVVVPIARKYFDSKYNQSVEGFFADIFGNINNNIMASINIFKNKYNYYPKDTELINLALKELYRQDCAIFEEIQNGYFPVEVYHLVWLVILDVFEKTKDGDQTMYLFYDATSIYIRAKNSASNKIQPLNIQL